MKAKRKKLSQSNSNRKRKTVHFIWILLGVLEHPRENCPSRKSAISSCWICSAPWLGDGMWRWFYFFSLSFFCSYIQITELGTGLPCAHPESRGQWLARDASAQASAACMNLPQGDKEREFEEGGQLDGVTTGIDHCWGKWEYVLLSESV